MCLAIGTSTRIRRSRLGRAWWQIAQAPERLLPLGAVVHLVLFSVLATVSQVFTSDVFPLATFVVLLAAANLAASGLSMASFARWAGRAPPHYVLYAGSFVLGFSGLLVLELTLGTGVDLLLVAAALVIAGALLNLRALGAVCTWVRPYRQVYARVIMSVLCASVLLLTALVVYARWA